MRPQHLVVLKGSSTNFFESRGLSCGAVFASRASHVVGARINTTVRTNEVRPNLTFLLGGSLNENDRSGE